MGIMGLNVKQLASLVTESPFFLYNMAHDKLKGARYNKYPRCITLYLTERCNFKCPMCHVKDSRAEKGKDLDFTLVEKVIKESKRYTPCIQFLGGEPTLYEPIIDAIKLVKRNGMLTTMTTNGLLLQRHAEGIVDSGLNFLSVSLDGWDEESQKKRGNVAGSFNKIIDGIKYLIKYRGRRVFPILKISTIVTKNNFEHLENIVELTKGLGITRWALYHYAFVTQEASEQNSEFYKKTGIGEFMLGDNIGETPYFSPYEVNIIDYNLKKIFTEVATQDVYIEYNYDKGLDLKSYYSFKKPGSSSWCTHPFTDIDIRGNGDLTICMGGYKLGNVAEDSIKAVWNGPKMEHFRQYFDKHKTLPMCFRCCALNISF
ncbi:MAG: radical SAM protein [Candidatus Magnetoovum sp. WYHC-5]|nr:radical SAM protein [Candidatus Magnetoovum sp. WYHC-5]